ncbi:MAG: S8 family serine peptidase [Planctomycetota bacterium]|jgi:hypothetical protein
MQYILAPYKKEVAAMLLVFLSAIAYAEQPEIAKPSAADIIRSAADEGKLVCKQTTPEEIKALLGPPTKRQIENWKGKEYLIFNYPNVLIVFYKISDGSVPFTLDELVVDGKEFNIDEWRKCILMNEDDLKKFDTWGGFWNAPRGVSLVNLDLRGHKTLLEEMRFDSRTKWPETNKMPDGFDPSRLLEEGKNPGLGIRSLHKQGIDGRGVGIAILDQVLLKDHVEYVDRIVRYEEIEMRRDLPPQMHGPPIVSIAVGKTCGVAPKAAVFYYAMMTTAMPDNSIYCDIIDKIIQHNKNASASEQIRVISISTGTFAHQANFSRWKETLRKADQHGILVVTCDPTFLRYGRLSRISGKNPDNPTSYRREGDFPGYVLLVPTNRTTASHNGPEVYTYWTNGGMSWAAPYLAGLAALAYQVNPEIEPKTIVELWLKTAVQTEAGAIVNPAGFIKAVQNNKK